MRVISFGGGVQSTAMAVLAAQGKIEAHAAYVLVAASYRIRS